MPDLLELPPFWALIGAFVGVILARITVYTFNRVVTWFLNRPKKVKSVDKSKEISVRCGACRSIITVPPFTSVVTDKGAQLVYRCQQCGIEVSIPADTD
jgi:hypothetical protein